MFQSKGFQLHRLVQEVERVVRMFCKNFRKPVTGEPTAQINVEANWIALDVGTMFHVGTMLKPKDVNKKVKISDRERT